METHGYNLDNDRENITLCELLDRVLNKGVVIFGEVTISVANIDLIYLGVNILLTSVETARRLQQPQAIEIKQDKR